ncbi:uncharacterized protein LOC106163463 isoform X2 [Lingula anatina]|nr:uncharacterized protein LOC106163463 isoform X2 [Lingula anatina]|eukprot:XP_013396512.1 uncharacterized protein LOC106163463 isoform X2 [Lingula anatina]
MPFTVYEVVQNLLHEADSPASAILVAGETSAGKSSLINLLLGEEVLPTSFISNTSVICEIKYDTQKRADVYRFGSDTPDVTFPLEKTKSVEQLKPYLTQTDSSRDVEVFEYERVEIFWPLDLLKHSVFLVDSPGVGENQRMTNLVQSYIPKASAFIYVINSMNAGGVQEGRLKKLLETAVNNSHEGAQDRSVFDPASSIFVLNRWDQVDADNKKAAFDDTLKKLKNISTKFHEGQLFPMATTQAYSALQQDVVNPDYAALLHGIELLIPRTQRVKQETIYRRATYLLQRSSIHLHSTIRQKRNSMSQDERLRDYLSQQLQILERQHGTVLAEINAAVIKASEDAAREILGLLKNGSIREAILRFEGDDFPDCKSGTQWPAFYKAAKVATNRKINAEVDKWLTEKHYFENIRNQLWEDIASKYQLLEHQQKLIEAQIAYNYGESEEIGEGGDQTTALQINESIGPKIRINKTQKVLVAATAPLWIPVGLVASVFLIPAVSAYAIKDKVSSVRYNKDKSKAMHSIAEKQIAKCCEKENHLAKKIEEMLRSQLEPLFESYDMIKQIVQVDVELLKEQALLHSEETARIYDCCKENRRITSRFDILYIAAIRDYCIAYTDICWGERVASGMFGDVRKATHEREDVAVKEMKCSFSAFDYTDSDSRRASDFLNEEEALRKLSHKNIIEYRGTAAQRVAGGSVNVAIIMEYVDFTLAQRIIVPNQHNQFEERRKTNRRVDPRFLTTAVAFFGQQIFQGLHYIHRQGYAHRDLKPENILISRDDQVKLADVGLCKPINDILGTTCGTNLYMAPEVRRGDIYGFPSDIFSMGLILWEMWFGMRANQDIAFRDVNDMSEWRPQFEQPGLTSPPHDLRSLIETCWVPDPRKRLRSMAAVARLEKLDNM